jgi:hypothetical protein
MSNDPRGNLAGTSRRYRSESLYDFEGRSSESSEAEFWHVDSYSDLDSDDTDEVDES